jgi:DNA-directed RNA polymerase beta' subunit
VIKISDKIIPGAKSTTALSIYKSIYEKFRDLFFQTDESYDENVGYSGNDQKLSFKTMLDSKKGIIRAEGLGKKADYSGRTVVIGDPTIDVDEVGLSEVFASDFTIPEEILTEADIDRFQAMLPYIDEAGVKHPGQIVRIESVLPNGESRKIEVKAGFSVPMKIGDIVRRKLSTGDPVVLSRQPVLHKGGYMGFYARIFPESGNVIRINPSVTTPFNADFDGDEMNVAIPQNIYTRNEVMKLMMVTHCARGDKASAPWLGLIQNGIITAHLLTKPNVRLERGDLFNIINQGYDAFNRDRHSEQARANFNASPGEFIKKLTNLNVNPYTGRAAISYYFPKDFVYERNVKGGGENIFISNGILISGTLTGADLGKSSNGIVDSILEQYGAESVIIFLSAIQQGLRYWIENHGYSVGYSSCTLSTNKTATFDPQSNIEKLIENARQEAAKVLEKQTISEADRTMQEKKVRGIVAAVRDKVTKLVRSGGVDINVNKNQLKSEVGDKGILDVLDFALDVLAKKAAAGHDTIEHEDVRNRVLLFEQSLKDEGRKPEKIPVDDLAREVEAIKYAAKTIFRVDNNDQGRSKYFLGKRGLDLKNARIEILNEALRIRNELIFASTFDTAFLQLVNSGAKGSPDNITQVMGLLGQQDINEDAKVLPFFEKNTYDPAAKGFCSSSFTKGLTPVEFYLHAAASRTNVIENNLKPSETGHFFRRAYTLMEDMVSYEDGTVRDETGRVVQFVYGGDFFDARRVVNVDGIGQFINVKQIARSVRVKADKQEFAVEYKPL